MKLYYYDSIHGNVGDDLNRYLWKELYAIKFEAHSDKLFLGIGTILNDRLPPHASYLVAGAGIGYGNLPNINIGEWTFIGVRGLESKRALHLADNVACIDPGYLAPRWFAPKTPLSRPVVGVIPHVGSMISMPWKKACKNLGLKILDVRSEPRAFIRGLVSCDRVLCEAMHGAILADAYDVPWQPILAHPEVNTTKWSDWGSSIGKEISHTNIPEAYLDRYAYKGKLRIKQELKDLLSRLGIKSRDWWEDELLPESTTAMFNDFQDALRSSISKEFHLTPKKKKDELIEIFDSSLRSYLSRSLTK